MPKGKPWSRDEEKRLRQMVQSGASISDLAEAFSLPCDAIRMKLSRIGLKVVVQKKKYKKPRTTTSVLSSEIITHEQGLSTLAAVIEALKQPGLDKMELQRLRILVVAVSKYDFVLEKFERWDEFENRLLDVEKKIAEVKKVKAI